MHKFLFHGGRLAGMFALISLTIAPLQGQTLLGELDINGPTGSHPEITWTNIDEPITTGVRIGSEPDQSGSLTVGSGIEWINEGGYYNFISGEGNVWTDDEYNIPGPIGLLIGAPDSLSGFVGDDPSSGTLILESGSSLNSWGHVWIGSDFSSLKTGHVTVHEGAFWHSSTDLPAQFHAFAEGFHVRNGELNVHGELVNYGSIFVGGHADSATLTVSGTNATMTTAQLDEFGEPDGLEGLTVAGSAGTTALLEVFDGGSVVTGFLGVGGNISGWAQGQVVVGNGSLAQSHLDAEYGIQVDAFSGSSSKLTINAGGRVDAGDEINLGDTGFGSGGGEAIIEVNDGGILAIPGGNPNAPFVPGIHVGQHGTLDVTGGGIVALGNNLGNPGNLDEGAIHIGFGARLTANNEVHGDVQVYTGGLLNGDGDIFGNVFANGGTINPGNSTGELAIHGNLVLDENSVLTIEISGTGHDRLSVSGSITLDGIINIAFIDGFSPELDDVFNLDIFLGEPQLQGTFTGFSVAGLDESLTLDVDFNALASGQPLSFTVIPEPASIALLLVGGALIARRRR